MSLQIGGFAGGRLPITTVAGRERSRGPGLFGYVRIVGLRPPTSDVLAAFGAAGRPAPLDGGQSSSWVAGDLVLKPLDLSERELEWQAGVLASIRCSGFRVVHPRRGGNGSLVVDGWCAWERVEGRHEARRWAEIIAAGERFHAAIADVPRPAFIGQRTDPWAIGDRVAWGDLPVSEFSHVKHLARLSAGMRPVRQPRQLIHGDLTGNVLFADDLPPAVIDFSPHWRPTGFAAAIVVGDALIWEGADAAILNAVGHIEQFDQLLLRALIYRAVTDRLFRRDEPNRPDAADPYLSAVELACHIARAS
jgi:uncharacterized protein (TIGR02569 family)